MALGGYVSTSQPLVTGEVGATANDTTTSGTDALLGSMTTGTLPAGDYLVWFSSSITTNAAGAAVTYSYYVGGTQKADSVRKSAVFDGGALSVGDGRGDTSMCSKVTVTGSQAIEVRWSVSSGTATCGPRTITWMKV